MTVLALLTLLKIICYGIRIEEVWVYGVLNKAPVVLAGENEADGLQDGSLSGLVVPYDNVERWVQFQIERGEPLESFDVDTGDIHAQFRFL
jgi:hypothetical protein